MEKYSKIFPDSVINQSYEQIIGEHNQKTNTLYITILIVLIVAFISLFFIYVDVGVSVSGVMNPRGESCMIISPANGILKIKAGRESKEVSKGDTLFVVVEMIGNDHTIPIQKKQYHEFVVCAPIDGICIKTNQLMDGLKVSLGQQLMELLPNNELRLECNIPTKDMGLIRLGLPCRLQVDAYNYNQWGMLEGELVEITNQPVMSMQGCYYKVYCNLKQNYLELKNGHKGYLRRGMTAKCRFVVNRRNLFQLLYDKIENWINPLNDSL